MRRCRHQWRWCNINIRHNFTLFLSLFPCSSISYLGSLQSCNCILALKLFEVGDQLKQIKYSRREDSKANMKVAKILAGQQNSGQQWEVDGVISSASMTASAKALIGVAVSGGSCNQTIAMGSNPPANTPPRKPWKQAGSSSSPLPFKPPSSGNGGEARDATL